MNSMFGKQFEPLTSSERMKQKRNLNIYHCLEESNNVCLDVSKNIRNAVNYESYRNAINGFYESKKEKPSIANRDCFNVVLEDNTSTFNINTFDDVRNSFIDWDGHADNYGNTEDLENMGISGNATDKGFVVSSYDSSGVPLSTFFNTGVIEKSSQIIYPYEKKGLCSKLYVPKLTFFDPSGNLSKNSHRDIKYFFPMSKLSGYENRCE